MAEKSFLSIPVFFLNSFLSKSVELPIGVDLNIMITWHSF